MSWKTIEHTGLIRSGQASVLERTEQLAQIGEFLPTG